MAEEQRPGVPPSPHGGAPRYPSQPSAASAAPMHWLQGRQPTTASSQIVAELIDRAIFSTVGGILGALCMIPYFLAVVGVVGNDSGRGASDASSSFGTVFGALALSLGLTLLVSVALLLVYAYLVGVKNKTPGFIAMKIELVSAVTGSPVGFGKAFLSLFIVGLASALTGGILGIVFWLSPLFDSTSGWAQAWQNKIIGAHFVSYKGAQTSRSGA